MNNKCDRISILLVSDVHEAKGNIVKLRAVLEKLADISFILCLGDLHNLLNEDPKQFNDYEGNLKAEQDIKDLMFPLCSNTTPIYFIPGNHDPLTLFAPLTKELQPNMNNIHNTILDINEDVQIVGFGGSIPGQWLLNNQVHWKGFPFNSEEELQKEFQQLKENFLKTTKQTIFMTHCGPSISSTTISYENSKQIQSGSTTFSQFLSTYGDRIIVNIHGHTHDGVGFRRIEKLKIVNAGPLVWENYTILDLIKKEGKWEVQNIKLMSL